MVECVERIDVQREYGKRLRNELKMEGWRSTYYWTTMGNIDANKLRKMVNKGKIRAKLVCTDGRDIKYYYHEAEIEKLYNQLKCE